VATFEDLVARGFTRCAVTARRVNITHDDPHELGPFCRLAVDDSAPDGPGVYTWTVDGEAMYVGKASRLQCITQGARMGRPYNDYTYIPASQCTKASDPRVRVNGLINRALGGRATIEWWWLQVATVDGAAALEDQLIDQWQPPWNRMGIRRTI